ncbi:MAG: DUF3370 domain-containing protein [Scytonematopsis contorta HA4267-MV1]|jgi:hypothetical protein|nr:DUF3370 domain-containing protein [Scytonematopsis contorta HA4267-MV1]
MLPFLLNISVITTIPVEVSPQIAQVVVPQPIPQEVRPAPEELPDPFVMPSQEVVQPREIRSLPGTLDTVPVFNSNSPEVVRTEGILLSTFSQQGMRNPQAHLNYPFKGRFDLFTHHITQARTLAETRSMMQGIIMYNPGREAVRLEILEAASYLTRPDALFIDLPDYVENPLGNVFSGPGSRVMSDILRGVRQGTWLPLMTIPPGHVQMLLNLPIPAGTVVPTSNTRSTYMRLRSSGAINLANLAMYAPRNPNGRERFPTLEEWQRLLINGNLAGPRDLRPSPMSNTKNRGDVIYGRVAGVAIGSEWQSQVTDRPGSGSLTIPQPGSAFSYGLSTLYDGSLGSGQVQTARLAVRYQDTAYEAHGNYGIKYNLSLPLQNKTNQNQRVTVAIETPIKVDEPRAELLFFARPERRVFFRGTVRLRFRDDAGFPQTRYVHLVQRRGQQGEPLVTLSMPPGDRRVVQVEFLYPPDATPPQVLTVRTLRR